MEENRQGTNAPTEGAQPHRSYYMKDETIERVLVYWEDSRGCIRLLACAAKLTDGEAVELAVTQYSVCRERILAVRRIVQKRRVSIADRRWAMQIPVPSDLTSQYFQI